MSYDRDAVYETKKLLSDFKRNVDLAFTDLSNLGISRIKYFTTHVPLSDTGAPVYVWTSPEDFPYEHAYNAGKGTSTVSFENGKVVSYALDFHVHAKTPNVSIDTELENHNIDYVSLCPPHLRDKIAGILHENLMANKKDISKAALRTLAKSLGNIKAGKVTKKRYAPEDDRQERSHMIGEELYPYMNTEDMRQKLEDYISFADTQLDAYKINQAHGINVMYEMGELDTLGFRVPPNEFPLEAQNGWCNGVHNTMDYIPEVKIIADLGDMVVGSFIPVSKTDMITKLSLSIRKSILEGIDRHNKIWKDSQSQPGHIALMHLAEELDKSVSY